MQKGWDARGLLRPLWTHYPGKRDALAKAVGSQGPTLSGINAGRLRLGTDLGRRLADELGVSLLELGAPQAFLRPEEIPLLARLEEAEAVGERLTAVLERLTQRVVRLEGQVDDPDVREQR